MKLHRSSKSLLHVLLHFVLFPLHMLFVSVSHFLACERWKKSLVEKILMRMWVRGRELLSSPLATLSLADQNIFVFLMESQTFPISLFPLVTPHFMFSSIWATWEDLFIQWQCVANFTSANNHFVAYDHKLPVSQTCAKDISDISIFAKAWSYIFLFSLF